MEPNSQLGLSIQKIWEQERRSREKILKHSSREDNLGSLSSRPDRLGLKQRPMPDLEAYSLTQKLIKVDQEMWKTVDKSNLIGFVRDHKPSAGKSLQFSVVQEKH